MRLNLDELDARIVPDGNLGDPPTFPISNIAPSSPAYSQYVAEVNGASVQYSSDHQSADFQHMVRVFSANASAHTQAGDAYADYLSTANSAYSSYLVSHTQLYNSVVAVVASSNATLTASINTASSTMIAAVDAVGTTADTALTATLTAMRAAFASADTAYNTASAAAWDAGNIDALDAAYATYIAAIAAAATGENVAVEAAFTGGDTAVTAAMDTLEAAMYTAEAAWTATVTPAYDSYIAADAAIWSQYLATESSAYDGYLLSLNGIAASQQAVIAGSSTQRNADVATAATAFTNREAVAWNAYLQSLTPDMGAEPRLAALPIVVGMPPLLAENNQPAPKVQNVQGQPPPIDWSKGTVVARNYKAWTNPDFPQPTGTVYKIEIGKDATGKPIEILAWRGDAKFKVEFTYFCHGLTFNGVGQGQLSPFGSEIDKILGKFYKEILSNATKAGDIVVWRDAAGVPAHSCIITVAAYNADGTLDAANSQVRTKNGQDAEQTMTFAALLLIYKAPLTWSYYTRT